MTENVPKRFTKTKMETKINSKGELVEILRPINMGKVMASGKKGQLYVDLCQGITGFKNEAIDTLMQKLKSEHLSKMFR